MKKSIKIIIPLLIVILLTGCNIANNTPNKPKKPVTQKTDTVKKEIKDIDKDLKYNLPLGLDSVKLMKSGKVIVTINNNAIGTGEQTVATDVKDIYMFTFGNGGYRSILFIKNDGTVSSISASGLIENKKIEILDKLGGYTNVVSIEQDNDQESMLINAVLKNGEKYMLDGYIK